MAGLAESVTERLSYKLYASAAIDATTEPVTSTAPGASGGQILRHVSHNLSLAKDSYRPNEKRQDAQQPMGKHGSRTVSGTINGFLSPGTHADLFAATCRSTWTAAVTATKTDFTSLAFDASLGTITLGSGDAVAKGYRVGQVLNFTGLTVTANNNVNFLITAIGGTGNKTISVYPSPAQASADTGSWNMASLGKSLIMPATGRTDYKLAFEVYNSDVGLSRLYTENRVSGFDLSVGVNANVGLNFNILGRNRQTLTGGSAPFFTAPTVETTTDIPTSMQGLLMLGGNTIGVITGLNIKVDLQAEAAKAINPKGLVQGILLGEAVVNGDFTVFLTDGVVLSAFDNETELSLMAYLPTSNAPNAPANVFFLPRIKINSNSESDVNKAKAIQCQFEAGRYFGNAPGVQSTTMMIVDTTIAA